MKAKLVALIQPLTAKTGARDGEVDSSAKNSTPAGLPPASQSAVAPPVETPMKAGLVVPGGKAGVVTVKVKTSEVISPPSAVARSSTSG